LQIAATPSCEAILTTPNALRAATDRGLRQKLYLSGAAVTLVIGGAAVALILTTASRLIHEQADRQLAAYTTRTARLVESAIADYRHEAELLALMPAIQDLARSARQGKGADPALVLARLRARTSFGDLSVYDRTGALLQTTAAKDPGAGTGEPWFTGALRGVTTDGAPYLAGGSLLLDIATPIRGADDRTPTGVLRATLPLDAVGRPLRRDLRVDTLTSVEVVDQRGMVALSSEPGARTGVRFVDDSLLGGTTDLRFAQVGRGSAAERLALVGIGAPRWTVVTRQPASAGLALLSGHWREIWIKAGVFALLALLLLAGLARWIDRRVIGPLRQVEGVASRVARGDLHEVGHLDTDGDDEVARLSGAIVTMVASLRQLVGSIRGSAGESVDIATSISAATEQMNAATIEVSGTCTDMTQRAMAQAGLVRETQDGAEKIRTIAEELAHGARGAAERNSALARMAQTSRERLTASAAELEALREEVRLGTAEAAALAEASAQIQQFVAQAKAVAAQTHMLALNAGIEAARAGEQGRGFAVVADEVRKLARQAEASANDTVRTVQAVLTRVEGTRKRLERLARGAEGARTAAQSSATEMERLVAQAEETDGWTQAISASSGDVHSLVTTMFERMQGITGATEEFAAAAQQIAASTQQLTASTEEVAATAQLLSGAAERLNSAVQVFEIEG
jgi:methyl-accepting chemotaxis protein